MATAGGAALRGTGPRRLPPSAPAKQSAVDEAILLPPASLPRRQVFKEMLLPYKSRLLKFPTSPLYCVATHLLTQGSARGSKQPIYRPALGLPAQIPASQRGRRKRLRCSRFCF